MIPKFSVASSRGDLGAQSFEALMLEWETRTPDAEAPATGRRLPYNSTDCEILGEAIGQFDASVRGVASAADPTDGAADRGEDPEKTERITEAKIT